MPNVSIIHFTGQIIHSGKATVTLMEREFAARLLAFTKNTRLNMNPEGLDDYLDKPWLVIEDELDYMAGTIPSSWEFVDVTFSIGQVSRACAQQITRTRFTPMDADIFGSYAMQSFRVGELQDLTFQVNRALPGSYRQFLATTHAAAMDSYREALAMGIPQEDARGLLPMDTHCNLVVKFNLRQLVDMLRTRDESLRVQGEYGEVARQMKSAVLKIWPWSERFFEPKDEKAIRAIEEVATELARLGSTLSPQGTAGYNTKAMSIKLAKAADLLKK